MDDRQIELVRNSFAAVVPIRAEAARIFYATLFEMDPTVRPLFTGDMEDQGAKLMGTLAVVVNGLRDLPSVVPVAQELARRHVAYGVRADHYPTVGAALLSTLKTGLGEGFDAETEAAWAAAYGILSGAMIEAAYPAAAE